MDTFTCWYNPITAYLDIAPDRRSDEQKKHDAIMFPQPADAVIRPDYLEYNQARIDALMKGLPDPAIDAIRKGLPDPTFEINKSTKFWPNHD